MNSFMHRTNTLLTFFGSVAAVLCILTSGTDLLHKSNPNVTVGLEEVKKLVALHGKRDQAVLTFNVDADLRSAFSWNTKQLFVTLQAEYVTKENKLNHVVLWDAILRDKARAHIKLRKHKTKYAFIDQFKGLRGADVNVTLTWHVMPYVGYFYSRSRTVGIGKLPDSYTG